MIKRLLKRYRQPFQKKWRKGKKRNKTRKVIAELFALNVNATISEMDFSFILDKSFFKHWPKLLINISLPKAFVQSREFFCTAKVSEVIWLCQEWSTCKPFSLQAIIFEQFFPVSNSELQSQNNDAMSHFQYAVNNLVSILFSLLVSWIYTIREIAKS